jgi:hypothetical protein
MEIFASAKRKNKLKKTFFTVLSRQKITRKHKPRFFHPLLKILTLSSLLLFAIWHFKKNIPEMSVPSLLGLSLHKDYHLDLTQTSGSNFSDLEMQSIRDFVHQQLRIGEKFQLTSLARKMQHTFPISSLHVFKSSPDLLEIQIKKRSPFLVIKGPLRDYILSVDGELYTGLIDSTTQLPYLSGLLDNRAPLSANEDNVIDVTPEDSEVLKDAIQLVLVARSSSFPITNLIYKKFRGFFISTTDIEVAIGNKPFEIKMERLQQLLKNLESKGVIAKKIEIDYEGKAFVTQTQAKF